MKILIIIHNQAGAGPFAKVLEMAHSLAEEDRSVTLLCTSPKNRFSFNSYKSGKVDVIESPDLLWGSLRQGIDLWNTVRRFLYLCKNDFDLIHAIDCRPVVILPALLLKWRKKIPLIISWWDLFGRGGIAQERSGKLYAMTIGRLETFFEEYFRKYAEQATVVSSVLYERLQNLNYPKEKIHLIRVGCNLKHGVHADRTQLREKLKLPNNATIFCYAGTLYKNDLLMLLGALDHLRNLCPDMPQTILIGNHKIDQKICKKLNIFTTGYLKSVDQVNQYLQASDYGLIPMNTSIANMARWPSKIGDYLSVGLPVLSTPVSDFPAIINKYNIGIVSKSGTSENYLNVLYDAVKTSPDEWKNMSIAALNYCKRQLDWTVISKQILKIYRQAL